MKYLAENVKNPDNNKTNSIYEWSRGSLKGKDLIVCTLNLNYVYGLFGSLGHARLTAIKSAFVLDIAEYSTMLDHGSQTIVFKPI